MISFNMRQKEQFQPKEDLGRKFPFEYLGRKHGYYAFRADMSRKAGHKPLDALTFQNETLEWLMDQRIVPNKLSYIGNGNMFNRKPKFPDTAGGSMLCVLLKRKQDMVLFKSCFEMTQS